MVRKEDPTRAPAPPPSTRTWSPAAEPGQRRFGETEFSKFQTRPTFEGMEFVGFSWDAATYSARKARRTKRQRSSAILSRTPHASSGRARARMARPLLVDVAMLVLAGAATQVASHLAGYPKPPITWIFIFAGLVLAMLGSPGHVQPAPSFPPPGRDPPGRIGHRRGHDGGHHVRNHPRRRPAHFRPDRPGLDPGDAVPLGRPHGPLHLSHKGDRPRRGPPDADRGRRQGRPPGGPPPDANVPSSASSRSGSWTTTRSSSRAARRRFPCSERAGTWSASSRRTTSST